MASSGSRNAGCRTGRSDARSQLVEQSHAVSGATPDALAAIRQPGVALAVWERRLLCDLRDRLSVTQLDGISRIDVGGSPADVEREIGTALSEGSLPSGLEVLLARDVGELASTFANIMRSERVLVRLERIIGDSCKRFHADYIAARLITTYSGPGTQWLEPADADRVEEGRAPVGATVCQIATGAVAAMKGRLWSPGRPLVHRSPPIAGSGHDRLVLAIDADTST